MTDTRSLLLAEAERLIRTRGYAGFSYADIAAAVGITKASIHFHFATKEVLASAVLDDYTARYREAIVEIERNEIHALDRILAYGKLYLNGAHQQLGCLCAAIAVERDAVPEGLRLRAGRFFEDQLEWLNGTYVAGLEQREVSDRLVPQQAARMILSTLEGALTIERLLSGGDGFAQTLDALRESLER